MDFKKCLEKALKDSKKTNRKTSRKAVRKTSRKAVRKTSRKVSRKTGKKVTKAELMKQAQNLKIKGRSKMNKAELEKAIAKFQN